MKQRIFYGWANVLVAFVGMALCYATFTVFAFGTFVRPLQEEFGWQRGELSFALTMTNIGVVIASPLLGIIIDRFGVRGVLIPSLILMGLTVASMQLLSGNIWHFYVMYLLVPLLGAGTLPQSYSRVIIAWFFQRRGIALGISLAGFGVGAAIVPIFTQWMIDNYGWRIAYAGFAAAIFGLSLPLTWFLLRESPGEMQLSPDGLSDAEAMTATQIQSTDNDIGVTGTQAAKTTSYWFILTSFFLFGISVTSIVGHLVPMLVDRGVEPQNAALCMTSLGLGLIFGRIFSGYLMDRFFAPFVAAVFLGGLIVGLLIFASGTATWLVFLAAILVGMSTGSEISEIAYIISRYFGTNAFGQIYGVMFAGFQLGAALGAPIMGMYYDRTGHYTGALLLMAGLVSIGTVLILLLKRPYPTLHR